MQERYEIHETVSAKSNEPVQLVDSNKLIIDNHEYWRSKISEFVSLPENWDGYQSIPLIETIASNGCELISCLSGDLLDKITDIFPNPNGTLTIEWENSQFEKLSLELGENNYSYFIEYNNQKPPKLYNGENSMPNVNGITSDLAELFAEDIPKIVL